MKPKINVIKYGSILDTCVGRFFEEYGSEFSRMENGEYVFSGGISENTMSKIFLKYVTDELTKHVTEFSYSNPEFFFVIGSCVPGENVLLDFGGRAPKLRRLIEIIPDVTYFLKESDIRLDMRMMNSVFERVFNKFMRKNGKMWSNVFFVKHRKADSYLMCRFFEKFFGSMVMDFTKRTKNGSKKVIFSVNESIDKICPFKDDYVKRGLFGKIEEEVYQYVDTCINKEF